MTAGNNVERLAHERREADRRYNEALTALDRAIAENRGANAEPGGVDRLLTPLILFLQQITAFVECKDRELMADVTAQIGGMNETLGSIGELQTQVRVLHHGLQQARPHRVSTPVIQDPTGTETKVGPPPASDDYQYVGFEDQFRGSEAAIQERLAVYVPLFAGCPDVLDLGCGRGEFLAALEAAGLQSRGVDANGDMVRLARERGLDVVHSDALSYLRELPDESLGGLIATQVVEHFEPAYLTQLLGTAFLKLRPGSPVVIETINPACWLAFFSSYIRDLTHVRPIHPETLQYLLRATGFERVEIRYSAPVPDRIKMATVDLPAEVVASANASDVALVRLAHAMNANSTILNNLMFTYLDYAAVARRM